MSVRKSRIQYRVPYADTDQMGVVYYANYLVYFERLRNQLLEDLGLTYKELERRGFGLPVVEAHVAYKAPAAYDDRLDISGWLAGIRGVRLRIDCEIECGGVLLATGHTVHCCLDLKSRRPVRVPPELLACLGEQPDAL